MLRTSYTVALLFSIMVAGAYWYTSVEAVCRLPVYYTLGELDERFGLSEAEARTALSSAESIWEEATGRNLFTYADEADLNINFIYDERQQSANLADDARVRLESQEAINDTLSETYERLVAKYKEEEINYESRLAAYERELNRYNEEVDKYNAEGGAPPAVYDDLQRRQTALDSERAALNQLAGELNQLSEQINEIGEQGNYLIRKYNDSVSRFNDTFVTEEEFTQGDYRGRSINIYTFSDRWELTLVLAHELGHALDLDHVEGEASIMHYLLGGQESELTLTAEDIAAFEATCGDVTVYERWREQVLETVSSLTTKFNN